MPESRPHRLSFTTTCSLDQVRPAARRLSEFLRTAGCPGEAMAECEMALVEACNNAVIHAVGQTAPVRIEIVAEPGAVTMEITDHTPGFPWPQPPTLPGPEVENGRGLFLITAVMDEVEYIRGSRQNTLRLRKLL